MKAKPFNEVNCTLRGNGDSIEDLPVYTDGLTCVSMWEVTPEELQEIIRTRKIYLTVFHTPNNFPPVGLSVHNPLPPAFVLSSNAKS